MDELDLPFCPKTRRRLFLGRLPTAATAFLSITLLCLLTSCGAIEPDPATGAGGAIEERGASTTDVELFVVQTKADSSPDALRQRLTERYGNGVTVERLFEEVDPNDDPDGMARMFRVAIPKSEDDEGNRWDTAYELETEFDLEHAEPDTATTMEASLESTRKCFLDEPAPDNKKWSIEKIQADLAWELEPNGDGLQFGEGVSVCHPDTGWSEHVELDLDNLDLVRSTNLLKAGTADGRDPLNYQGPLLSPGHGTSTGSVIVSRHENGEVFGVAPRAQLVPIRTVKSVVQVLDSDLARAVNYSVDAGCDVVSMSLGGRSFFGLKAAIKRAVRNNVVVAAAAGNCVGFVTAPAAYKQTLAIAAINIDDEPWQGTSKGKAVDVSAPGEHVWTAKRREASAGTTDLTPGQGTSYAVANTAGVAALWLAFHGRDNLIAGYPEENLQSVFRRHLVTTSTAPTGWDASRFGVGIINAHRLLSDPLPEVLESSPFDSGEDETRILSSVLGTTEAELRRTFGVLFGLQGAELDAKLEEVGPELVQLALSDPDAFRAWMRSATGEEGAAVGVDPDRIKAAASARLREGLQ